MKDMYKIFAMGALALSPLAVMAGGDAPDGTHATTTQTQIRVDVDKDTSEVVLSKSDTVPDIYTNAYVLKHADPYEVRPYITNASGSTLIDGTATRVEAAKYDDGTGVLIVSAEDYRFEKQNDGTLSIPELIAKLDRPGFTSSSGQPKWIYYCKHRAPSVIQDATKTLFVNKGGSEALKSGKDAVGIDTEINAVIFYAIPSNMDRLKALIEEYDVPFPNIKATVKVYEFSEEKDMALGVDYEAWTNDVLRNMLTVDTGVAGATRYVNFNPQWTTDYIDFLVSKGKGKVVTSLQGNIPDYVAHESTDAASDFFGYFNLGSYIQYTSTDSANSTSLSTSAASATLTGYDYAGATTATTPTVGDGSATVTYTYSAADNSVESITTVSKNGTTTYTYDSDNDGDIDGNDRAIQKALHKTIKTANYGLQIGMEATAYGNVNQFVYNITNTNLIGYNSDGSPRTSTSTQTGDVHMSPDATRFVIGGVEKKQVVKVVNKMPLLGSIPVIGFLFCSEDEVVKTSQLVTVVSLEFEDTNKGIDANASEIINEVNSADATPGFDQYLLDDTKSIEADATDTIDAIGEDCKTICK